MPVVDAGVSDVFSSHGGVSGRPVVAIRHWATDGNWPLFERLIGIPDALLP